MRQQILNELRSSPATALLLLMLLGGNGTEWIQAYLAPQAATAEEVADEVEGGWTTVYDQQVDTERAIDALRRDIKRLRGECRAAVEADDDWLADGMSVEDDDL